MEKLGSPEELAERIKRESGWIQPADGISPEDGQTPPPQGFGAQNYGAQQAYQQQTSNGGAVAVRVIALILTFPFWIAVFSILISLFFVIWGVYIAFPCGAISAFAAGIMEMKTYAGYGMLILLCSILFAGLAVLLANPAANLTRLTAHGTASFARFLFAPSAKGSRFVWKKTGRAALAAGIGLVIVGLFAGGAVFGIVRPTPEKYGEHLGLETKEYDLTADHSSITANIDFGSVTVKKSQDGKASLKAINIEEKYLTVSDETALSINYKRADKNYFNFDLFGMKLKFPILAGPVGAVKMHYGDKYDDMQYNDILVRACAAAGIAAMTGDGMFPEVVEAASVAIRNCNGYGIPTIKPWDKDTLREKFALVEKSCCSVVAMDIDAAGLPFLQNMNPPAGAKSVEELAEVVKMAGKPFIVKGIMTVAGAVKARDAGAAGIIVSNHGGRVLDQCPATAEVLPEIAEAVPDMTILVDGGIRSGVDVFKAIALGADAVVIARPYVTAVYGGEDEGVKLLTDKLGAELADTMNMCGAASLEDIKESMVRFWNTMDNKELYEYARSLCEQAQEEEGTLEVFWNRISEYPDIIKEFDYYREHNDFLCELKPGGITVADILVWQIDRFKAALDEGKFALKYNGPHMVLGAFYTMADVIDDPDSYVNRFRSETGSDYEGKSACVDK